MKKLITASLLTLGIILLSGCSFNEKKIVDNPAMTEQITALQQQMSGFSFQMETLKDENEQLKKESEELKKEIEKYKQALIQEKILNKSSNTKSENIKIVVSNNCAKEGEITERMWDNPKYCCDWLEWFLRPDMPDWVGVELLCYKKSKWEPKCIIDWHRTEWRYYNDWSLLKKDDSCKVANTYKIDDTYFNKYKQPIDSMFRNALIRQNLWYITIPNHDSVKTNPSWVIDIDWWYRFTISSKDEVCSILKTFGRSDLSCYDAENGASIYIEFKILDNTYTNFRVLHYVGMQETKLHDMKYKIVDLK